MFKNLPYIFLSSFFLFLFSSNIGFSQSIETSVINASGNSFINDKYVFEWSVGEISMIETMVNNQYVLTNGLLQPLAPVFTLTSGFSVEATNIITPNHDGKNDKWIIKEVEKYPENEVTVFNRQGNIVFKTKNYQNDWQGESGGNPLPAGTYYYILSMKKNGENGFIKGFITILK